MSVRYLKLDKYGNPNGIHCPIISGPACRTFGGVEFVCCQGDCAWFSERNTDDGSAFFCRNDIIGFREIEAAQPQKGQNND